MELKKFIKMYTKKSDTIGDMKISFKRQTLICANFYIKVIQNQWSNKIKNSTNKKI